MPKIDVTWDELRIIREALAEERLRLSSDTKGRIYHEDELCKLSEFRLNRIEAITELLDTLRG